jgi:hypothetical protein
MLPPCGCPPPVPETFWTLLRNAAHWEFELFLMLVFDGIVGALLWPTIKKHWNHHLERDREEGKNGH